MKIKSVLLVFILLLQARITKAEVDYVGDNLLSVVGKSKTSNEFKEFKTFWLLDSKLENNYGGVKLLINSSTQTADTLLIAGAGFSLDGTKFYAYSSKLPYGLKISDTYSEICKKTSMGSKISNGYFFEFIGYSLLVNYNSDLKIKWMKIFVNEKKLNPEKTPVPVVVPAPKADGVKVIPPPVKAVEVAKEEPKKEEPKPVVKEEPKKEEVKPVVVKEETKLVVIAKEEPKAVVKEEPKKEDVKPVAVKQELKIEEPKPIEVAKTEPVKPADVLKEIKEAKKADTVAVVKPVVKPAVAIIEEPKKEEPKKEELVVKEEPVKIDVVPAKPEVKKDTVRLMNRTPFQMAIMNVFYAYDESSFKSIKGEKMDTSNFWSYQFLYKSKLKIPGEKYSAIYNYPFANSSENFVTVLREGAFDGGFGAVYGDMEMRLRQNLSVAEGWKAITLPSGGKPINPIEFKHSKYGSVILDYSKNAKGQHLLFLRYLFENN